MFLPKRILSDRLSLVRSSLHENWGNVSAEKNLELGQTPSTGVAHSFSNNCHSWLHHRPCRKCQLTDSFSLVLKWLYICNRQLRLYQVVSFIAAHVAYASTDKAKIV